jgi:acyl dehydratase
MTARVNASDVNVGEELKSWTYTVVREDLVKYAHASGDGNPIHQDENFAKSVGLPDVIAHGMHTMAKVGQFVTDWAGDPAAVVRFKTRFTKPVIVPAGAGNSVIVGGKVTAKDGQKVTLELSAATADGTSVAEAEADVVLA